MLATWAWLSPACRSWAWLSWAWRSASLNGVPLPTPCRSISLYSTPRSATSTSRGIAARRTRSHRRATPSERLDSRRCARSPQAQPASVVRKRSPQAQHLRGMCSTPQRSMWHGHALRWTCRRVPHATFAEPPSPSGRRPRRRWLTRRTGSFCAVSTNTSNANGGQSRESAIRILGSCTLVAPRHASLAASRPRSCISKTTSILEIGSTPRSRSAQMPLRAQAKR